MFGEENRAKPKPSITNVEIILIIPVVVPTSEKRSRPMVVRVMPAEESNRGSIRSDNRPARGEKRAIITGWATRMVPAVRGSSPLIYCR